MNPPSAKNFVAAFAATVALAIFAVMLPIGGMLLIPLVMQPALAFGLRHGARPAAALLAGTTALVIYVFGVEIGTGYGLLALMALVLVYSFGRGWPIERVVSAAVAAMLAALGATLSYFLGSPGEIRAVLALVFRENLQASLELYRGAGFSGETVDLVRERAPQIIDMVLTMVPALVCAAFAVLVLLSLFFLLRRFPERRSEIVREADLREWRAPEWLVWPFVAAGFVFVIPGSEAFTPAALNLLLITAVFYFFHGLSIVGYYFDHKHVPRVLRGLLYLAIMFEQILTIAVVVLGLFDLWGDFRRLKKKDLHPDPVA
jgi:uncharacterized protein YybS (DUF2232 family)